MFAGSTVEGSCLMAGAKCLAGGSGAGIFTEGYELSELWKRCGLYCGCGCGRGGGGSVPCDDAGSLVNCTDESDDGTGEAGSCARKGRRT